MILFEIMLLLCASEKTVFQKKVGMGIILFMLTKKSTRFHKIRGLLHLCNSCNTVGLWVCVLASLFSNVDPTFTCEYKTKPSLG